MVRLWAQRMKGQLSCYKFQGLTLSLLCTDTNTTLQIHSSLNRSRITQTRTVNANNADDKYVLTHIRTIDVVHDKIADTDRIPQRPPESWYR
jgi:hypothetical protein